MSSPTELKPPDAKALLADVGFLQKGHFVNRQGSRTGLGWHSSIYLDETPLLADPTAMEPIAQGIAHKLAPSNLSPEVIVVQPLGPIGLGTLVARSLGINFAFTERGAVSREHFKNAVSGKKVAIVATIVDRCLEIEDSIRATKACGGQVICVSAIWSRGEATSKMLGTVFRPLIAEEILFWKPRDCWVDGLCSQNVPINRRPGCGLELEQLGQGVYLTFV